MNELIATLRRLAGQLRREFDETCQKVHTEAHVTGFHDRRVTRGCRDARLVRLGTSRVTLDAQGRVLLPRPLRQALGLGPGARLVALVEDGRLVLTPWERLEEELWAELADVQESLAEELLRERRLEAERDA